MDQPLNVIVQCSNCGKANSIPSGHKGRAGCQNCGGFLQNPLKELEIEGYDHIRKGMFALILFSVIVIAPSVYSFFEMTLFEEDPEETEDVAGIEYSSDTCDPESSEYDIEECFREIELALIIAQGINILIYSIPIYGLVKISIGVSKLSRFNTTKF